MPRRGTHNTGDLVEWFNAVGIIEDISTRRHPARALVRFLDGMASLPTAHVDGETSWITVNSRLRVISQA